MASRKMNSSREALRYALAILITAAAPILLAQLFPSQFQHEIDKASYVVFHNIAEFFSIMVSLSIFGVGWYTYDRSKDQRALFLGAAFLAIGIMDFMHAMSNAAMPAFITPNTSNKSTQFWIAVRLFGASVFLASAYVYPERQNRLFTKKVLLSASLAATGLVFSGIIFYPDSMPATFVEGVGLTPFKKIAEYMVIFLTFWAAVAYWKRMARTGDRLLLYYIAAFTISIFSELAFAVYTKAFDTYNVLGHIYKIAAFFLIYKGIFAESVKQPYVRLFDANERLRIEIAERERAEAEIRKLNLELNERVVERTARLETANAQLHAEIGERKRAEERILHQNTILDGINRIFRETLTAETEEELGRACLAVAEEVTGSKFGFISEIEPDGLLHVLAMSDPGWAACTMSDKTGHRRPPGDFKVHGIYGRVVLDGKGFFTNDPASHPASIGTSEGHPPIKAFLGVPLVHAGKTIGMVAVGNREGGYREEDLNALEALAVSMVEAIMRKRAEEKIAHLASFPEINPNPILELEPDENISYVNPAMRALFPDLPEKGLGHALLSEWKEIAEKVKQEETHALTREVRTADRIYHQSIYYFPEMSLWRIYHLDITERRRAEEELQRENRVIAFANRILEAFVKETGGDMYDKALDIVLEGMQSRHGVFGYIDEHGDLMCPTMSKIFDECEMADKCICYTRGQWKGLWSRALLEQKTLYSNKPASVPSGHVAIRNNMATPILFQGNVIGLFNLANKDTDYTEEDREFIEGIAARIAPVLFAWIQKELREDERKRAEEERGTMVEFLGLVNESAGTADLIHRAATFFQRKFGFEAVGIRLKDGDDYPYYEARGFPEEFVLAENSLCARDGAGKVLRDSIGNPVLACMCGNIICGRSDPSKPFFSPGGSFWSNSTTELLATTTEKDRLARTRNRCNGEGYESVALIPMHVGDQRLGLLQMNDRRKGMFSADLIALWERLARYLGIALAKSQAEEMVKTALGEKEVLLKELYHRTKNNMNVISSLMNIQARSIEDGKLLEAFKETQSRIKAMSLVHEKLYASRDLSHLDMKGYIEDLAHGIFAACKEDSKRVSLSLRLESVPLPIDMAVPVGLILNELISNSLKHAFPEGREGEIRISLRSSGGRVRLEYADNGMGLDGDFEALRKKSLGLKLVSTLVKQLAGEMRVVNNRGAEFIFSWSGGDRWQRFS